MKFLRYFSFLFGVFLFLNHSRANPYAKYFADDSVLKMEYSGKDTILKEEGYIVLLTKEEGDSGEYINYHIQKYNSKYKIVSYIRVSRFYDSLCYDGIVEERECVEIKKNKQKLVYHDLFDENNNKLDTIGCQFPYRHPFELTYDLSSRCKEMMQN